MHLRNPSLIASLPWSYLIRFRRTSPRYVSFRNQDSSWPSLVPHTDPQARTDYASMTSQQSNHLTHDTKRVDSVHLAPSPPNNEALPKSEQQVPSHNKKKLP
jgi:hypothetical protein